jgi:phage repressor protein C with HTH and peptisase S24 domain
MFIPKNIDADIAFPTFGHSMYPEISNGDKVAYKFLKDWSFFYYGMKYLIITDEQRMVKYIKKHSQKGFLLLESRNSDYEPIDMPIKSIKYILQVRYIGKIEM